MGWLGLDDTDYLGGGCTTQVFDSLLQSLPSWVEVGQPRLVRLWPFAENRTRGNAALAVELSCEDESTLIPILDAYWSSVIEPLGGFVSPSMMSSRVQVTSSPGMVWFSTKPDEGYYRKAVREEVTLEEAPVATRSWGGRGQIGAIAAISWPSDRITYEAIAWRKPQNYLLPRMIDEGMIHEIDAWPEIIFSRDPRKGTSLIAPRGQSPVLFGVRARTSDGARKAASLLVGSDGTEEIQSLRVFLTNQASGDHLGTPVEAELLALEVHPQRKHARLDTDIGPMVAFCEGGPVNKLARWLIPGDRFQVRGLIDQHGVLHIEQMKVTSYGPRQKQRPLCEDCGQRLKSMGTNQGLRCPSCRRRFEDGWIDIVALPPFEGWVEPSTDARRHLARPLDWVGEK
ncbi:MAG: DUF1743 domain-containing protein [Candidatus Poseidonia sp.]|nr:DUF1743 domain-containing protein [Poseidonia sp.]